MHDMKRPPTVEEIKRDWLALPPFGSSNRTGLPKPRKLTHAEAVETERALSLRSCKEAP